jgi:hypothetical protein
MRMSSFPADGPLQREFPIEQEVHVNEGLQQSFQPEKHQVLVIPAKDHRKSPVHPSVNQATIDVKRVHAMLNVQNPHNQDPKTSHIF